MKKLNPNFMMVWWDPKKEDGPDPNIFPGVEGKPFYLIPKNKKRKKKK